MPSYSFKERFVPMVMDGSKPHTIRARRKKGYAKIGSMLYLFSGLRTKFSRRLRTEPCTDVRTIIINQHEIVLCDYRLTDDQLTNDGWNKHLYGRNFLTKTEMNKLAWKDGFRAEGSTLQNPDGSFDLMIRWWKQTHTLPFIGDIIYWNPNPQNVHK